MSLPAIEKELDFCLLIPCYNNTEGLKRSLASVHYPTNKYLIVVVDDGSNDPVTFESIQQVGEQKPIHILRLESNKGITYALNTGLQWILNNTAAKYIGRLDCSDVCHEKRFVEQVHFLETHLTVGLLGSWCIFKSKDSAHAFRYTTPLTDSAIRKWMHLRNVFIHPAVMFRTELIKKAGLYPYQYPHAEDYAFFWMLLQHTEAAILNQYLVTCTLNPAGLSAANRRLQMESCKKIIAQFGNNPLLKALGLLNTLLRMLLPQKLILRLKTWKTGWAFIHSPNRNFF